MNVDSLFGIDLLQKNYDLTKMFVLRLIKMVANHGAPKVNRSLSSNLWWLRSANHMKFSDVYGEIFFSQKYLWVKYVSATTNLSQKYSLGFRNTLILRKRKVADETASKKTSAIVGNDSFFFFFF